MEDTYSYFITTIQVSFCVFSSLSFCRKKKPHLEEPWSRHCCGAEYGASARMNVRTEDMQAGNNSVNHLHGSYFLWLVKWKGQNENLIQFGLLTSEWTVLCRAFYLVRSIEMGWQSQYNHLCKQSVNTHMINLFCKMFTHKFHSLYYTIDPVFIIKHSKGTNRLQTLKTNILGDFFFFKSHS